MSRTKIEFLISELDKKMRSHLISKLALINNSDEYQYELKGQCLTDFGKVTEDFGEEFADMLGIFKEILEIAQGEDVNE